MTHATQQLLEQVEALSDQERSELVAELAPRVARSPHDAPPDSDLIAAADRLFVELDHREEYLMPSPRRGEVWLVDLGMAAKVRPG